MKAVAVRWAGDEPFPGLVEVQFVDKRGRLWSFIDKAPMFEIDRRLLPDSPYPVPIAIVCDVERRDGDDYVVSSRGHDIETVEGVTEFEVTADQLLEVE